MPLPNSIAKTPAILFVLLAAVSPGTAQRPAKAPPNLVLILADDLGYGEVGCYGQTKIRTPRIDALAAEGLRFTRAYCGAPTCAPSRCVLLTGRASPRAAIRGNREIKPEGQEPLPAAEVTIAEVLAERGYVSAACGKWGLGAVGSSGDPNAQGFDHFFGYICQRQAHNLFPPHLWLDGRKLYLDNPDFSPHQKQPEGEVDASRWHGREAASDRILDDALGFIRRHRDRPFFLYLPLVEPHLALQPEPEWVDRYPREWDETPYRGENGYLPHPRPRAAYAALISQLDDRVGRVVSLIDSLGLAEDTLIVFTSDNGPTHDVGGVDTRFFESTGGLRGRKGSLFEGGIRVPFIARWKGRIRPGTQTAQVTAFQDLLPTFAELGGRPHEGPTEGLSFSSAFERAPEAAARRLVFEFFEYGGQQAVIEGRWKAVRQQLHKGNTTIQLFDLDADPAEARDLAGDHPEIVVEMDRILGAERTPNPVFPIAVLDERR